MGLAMVKLGNGEVLLIADPRRWKSSDQVLSTAVEHTTGAVIVRDPFGAYQEMPTAEEKHMHLPGIIRPFDEHDWRDEPVPVDLSAVAKHAIAHYAITDGIN